MNVRMGMYVYVSACICVRVFVSIGCPTPALLVFSRDLNSLQLYDYITADA